jgi:hypothetical protein
MDDNTPNSIKLEKLTTFIEQTPVSRLSRNLRNLLLEHLAIQKDGYTFDLEDLLVDMLNLFEFLEEVE